MFFPTDCPRCSHINRAEPQDNGVHLLVCSSCGQKYCVFLRKQKFEMLFDFGTRALLDGYGREAVASFAAALERFFEFYVWAFVLERSAGSGEDFEEVIRRFEQSWRHVVSQSERQLGMFALAYLLHQNKEPDFLVAKVMGTDFRNKVIHRGYLPSHREVENYAAKVFALIDRLLSELGSTGLQAELLQAHRYDQYLATLPADTVAVFEEHPGMFRARRFGGVNLRKTTHSDLPTPKNIKKAKNSNQHNAIFQQALEERGEFLYLFEKREHTT